MSKTHSFDVEIASKIGIEKALILKELESICQYKKNNNIDEKDGENWVYYSSAALAKKFPYMSPKSISRWMIELENSGYIKSGQLSNDKRDRVKWYSVKKSTNCISQNEESSISQNEECNIKDTTHTEYTPNTKKEIYKEKFEKFRKLYKGTKRGFEEEFETLRKHKDWKDVLEVLEKNYIHQLAVRSVRENAGVFVPYHKNLKTYLNNRCWTEDMDSDIFNVPKSQRSENY